SSPPSAGTPEVCLALVRDGEDARDLPPRELQARRVLQRPGRRLEAEVEQLLARLPEPVLELVVGHVPVVLSLHSNSSASRLTILVLTGSFCPASRSASRASGSFTPASSNITRPG